jgi:hypothetical protein
MVAKKYITLRRVISFSSCLIERGITIDTSIFSFYDSFNRRYFSYMDVTMLAAGNGIGAGTSTFSTCGTTPASSKDTARTTKLSCTAIGMPIAQESSPPPGIRTLGWASDYTKDIGDKSRHVPLCFRLYGRCSSDHDGLSHNKTFHDFT